jgi:hypothetical protein
MYMIIEALQQAHTQACCTELRGEGGRELAIVKTKIEEAIMWAKKGLDLIDNPPPHDHSLP